MKYSELVRRGASETELQKQLTGDGMTAVTVRIPRNLKEVGVEGANLHNISFSALVRMCMIEELVKKRQ